MKMNRFPSRFYPKQSLHSKCGLTIIGLGHKETFFTNSESIMQKKYGSNSDLMSSIPNPSLRDSYLMLFFFKCHVPRLSAIS